MPRTGTLSRGLPSGPVTSHRVGRPHQHVSAVQSGAPWAPVTVKRLPVRLTAMRATTPLGSVTSYAPCLLRSENSRLANGAVTDGSSSERVGRGSRTGWSRRA